MSKDDEKHDKVWIARTVETYFDGAGREAAERAGRGPQLKGIVQEVVFRDQLNAQALLHGRVPTARLSERLTDPLVDVLDGVQRYQVKDVTSAAGQRELARRVSSGQYGEATLVGSPETVTAASKQGISIKSTGLPSRTATRVADNAGAPVRDANVLRSNVVDVGHAAVAAGAVSGVVSVVCSAVAHREKLRHGEVAEFAREVATDGMQGAAVASAKTILALGAKEAAKFGAKRLGSEGLKIAVGSNAGTAVCFGVVELGWDIVQYNRGELDRHELSRRAVGTLGASTGAATGAAAGAALGSVVPVLGTAIGGALGGFFGGFCGSLLGRWIRG